MAEMKKQSFRNFGALENNTWKILFDNLIENRKSMAHPIFLEGIEFLGLTSSAIPNLNKVNAKLSAKTGWRGIPVEGLEEGESFYPALARGEYPIGNFIRDAKDINYTPAPDIFHDLYGHLPFFVNDAYAKFCLDLCKLVVKHIGDSRKQRMFERFFWFTIEFAITETPVGRRIFGAGIISSKGESEYALSSKPNLLPFDVKSICDREFRIDEFQPTIFLLQSPEQLYESLGAVEKYIIENHHKVPKDAKSPYGDGPSRT